MSTGSAQGVSLATLNARTCINAVRAEAERMGVDSEALLDSQRFYTTVTALDPDEAGFPARVRELVISAAGQAPASPRAAAVGTGSRPAPSAARARAAQESEQWTMDHVKAASPSELQAAMNAGLLQDLGIGTKRGRR